MSDIRIEESHQRQSYVLITRVVTSTRALPDD
jgi:hypothetical protein